MPSYEAQIKYKLEGYNFETVEAESREEAEKLLHKKYNLDEYGENYFAHHSDFQPDLDLVNDVVIDLCNVKEVASE